REAAPDVLGVRVRAQAQRPAGQLLACAHVERVQEPRRADDEQPVAAAVEHPCRRDAVRDPAGSLDRAQLPLPQRAPRGRVEGVDRARLGGDVEHVALPGPDLEARGVQRRRDDPAVDRDAPGRSESLRGRRRQSGECRGGAVVRLLVVRAVASPVLARRAGGEPFRRSERERKEHDGGAGRSAALSGPAGPTETGLIRRSHGRLGSSLVFTAMGSAADRWRRQPTGRFLALAALASIALFAASFAAIRAHGENPTVPDVARYYDYGNSVAAGRAPYRDFRLEYPPAALAVFVLPSFGVSGASWTPHENASARRYSNLFAAVMILLGAAAIALTALSLRPLQSSVVQVAGALGLLGLVPLLLGGVVYTRYDLWPAALVAAAVGAVLFGRFRLGSAALGIAVGAKLYPLVLVPLFLVQAWKQRGRREALACLGVTAGVVAAIF